MPIISRFDRSSYSLNGFDAEYKDAPSAYEFNAVSRKRGGRGLSVGVSGAGNEVYLTKDAAFTLAAGATKYIGFWMQPLAAPSADTYLLIIKNATPTACYRLTHRSAGNGDALRTSAITDASAYTYAEIAGAVSAAWHWVVLEVTCSDGTPNGGVAVWVDGTRGAVQTGIDNDVIGLGVMSLEIGVPSAARDGYAIYIDDLVIADTYPIAPQSPAATSTSTGTASRGAML